MKFQTVKSKETIKAENIFREIVQNSVYENDYILNLVYDDGSIEKIKIPIGFELQDEYPIVVLNDLVTTWDIPKNTIPIPSNNILFNKYYSMKYSIDFVFCGDGKIDWKRDKGKRVENCEGVDLFCYGCLYGFELVHTNDLEKRKIEDFKKYNITNLYKVDTLKLIDLYTNNMYYKNDCYQIPVSKIL